MILLRELSVGTLELTLACRLGHAEHLVVAAVTVDHRNCQQHKCGGEQGFHETNHRQN